MSVLSIFLFFTNSQIALNEEAIPLEGSSPTQYIMLFERGNIHYTRPLHAQTINNILPSAKGAVGVSAIRCTVSGTML